ncbi:MAG: NfeD family protein [Alistipes sp.]|jgi:membrane-bound ClpP family serine protease|nr:NfeD family protein [Alistipes sp.]MBQ2418893.1 NfeD family protein [Alistipes sp.]
MWYIILLILLGVLFCIAELLLFPGLSIGAILAVACYGGAVWYAFESMGTTAGIITIIVVLVVSLISVIFSLRAKTWQYFALRQQIDSTSMPKPEKELSIGAVGTTISRLSPMGKVNIGGKVYEAKSADVFIDQREQVEVVGFENFNVIVRKAN